MKNLKNSRKIAQIEVQPEDLRKKLKADYLVEYQMYANAVSEYRKILSRKGPGKLGASFYASILNNMGAANARMFLYKEAADCLWQSYGMVRSNEVYRRYLTALSLCLSSEEYDKKLEEQRVPETVREKISQAVSQAKEEADAKAGKNSPESQEEAEEVLEELKQLYHKSTRS